MDTRQANMGVTIITVLLAVVLQLVLAPALTLFGVVPNFMLVAAVFTAMRNGPVRATVVGFILGLTLDLCSLGPFGAMTLVFTLLSYAVSTLNKGGLAGNVVIDIIIMFAALIMGELLVSVIYAITGANPDFFLSLAQLVLPAIVYDTMIGCIVLIIFNQAQGGRSKSFGSRAGSGRSLSRKLNK